MTENYGISVLISVYHKENPEFLELAVRSMIEQTRVPDEVVIVEDGPLTQPLYEKLSQLEEHYPTLIKRYPLSKNQGLGLALKYGVEQCNYSLIARMDSDDISVKHRLEVQEKKFIENPKLDMVGGHISEFIDDYKSPVSSRIVPLSNEDIIKYQRMRSAFNHMTVMFKKEAVLRAGNYEDGLYMEDDLLWANMIASGAVTMNVAENLCYVRVGNGMFERRGGLRYLKLYQKARKLMYQRGQINYWEYVYGGLVQCIVSIVPSKLRQIIFMKMLRR